MRFRPFLCPCSLYLDFEDVLNRSRANFIDHTEQRIEELRRVDQEADFARQETILKLISTELTKNTTRVVEQAIKSEVQSTVLPALEVIAKNEIRSALNSQITKGVSDSLRGVSAFF